MENMEAGVYRIVVAPDPMAFLSSMRRCGSQTWIVHLIVAKQVGGQVHELDVLIDGMTREDGSGQSFCFDYTPALAGKGGRGYINFATRDGEDRGWIEVSN